MRNRLINSCFALLIGIVWFWPLAVIPLIVGLIVNWQFGWSVGSYTAIGAICGWLLNDLCLYWADEGDNDLSLVWGWRDRRDKTNYGY